MKERLRYVKCAENGNEWCNNQLNSYAARVDAAQAAYADSVATITSARTTALAELMQKRDTDLSALQASGAATVEEAKGENLAAAAKRDGKARFSGIIFIVLTVFGQLIFYATCYWILQIEAGSGITYQLEPNEFWAEPTVLAELWTTISWRTEREARATIKKVFPNTADRDVTIPYSVLQTIIREQPVGALPEAEPSGEGPNYFSGGTDYDDFFDKEEEQPATVRRAIGYQRSNSNPIENAATNYAEAVATVVNKGPATDADYDLLADNAISYLKRSAEAEQVETKARLALQAEQVVRAYLGPQAKEESVARLMQQLREHVFEGGQNPFSNHHERRRIGFYNSPVNNGPVSNSPVSTGSKLDAKQCDHCQKWYQPKTWNQRFCSNKGEGNCKDEYHAAQHGGNRFNPKRYRNSSSNSTN